MHFTWLRLSNFRACAKMVFWDIECRKCGCVQMLVKAETGLWRSKFWMWCLLADRGLKNLLNSINVVHLIRQFWNWFKTPEICKHFTAVVFKNGSLGIFQTFQLALELSKFSGTGFNPNDYLHMCVKATEVHNRLVLISALGSVNCQTVQHFPTLSFCHYSNF